jgi:putative membrane protein
MTTSHFSWKRTIRLLFTGAAMGAADIVPGVSGGTVAFLMGIYEELIHSIKTLSGEVIRLLIKGKVKDAFQRVPFQFLVPLGTGLLLAVISLSKTIAYLLSHHPTYLWSFFFGLVVASIWVVRTRVKSWDMHDIVAMAGVSILAFVLVGAVPVETPNNLITIFLSGFIAICAMILPGISGSFLLVIMGKYEQVLSALNNRDILTLSVFMIGAVAGLAVFSRVLSYLFAKHHDILIAGLMGFMIGSLRKVWPWKEVVLTRINPSTYLCIALMLAGFAAVTLLDRLQTTREHVGDIHDKAFIKSHKQAVESQKPGKI